MANIWQTKKNEIEIEIEKHSPDVVLLVGCWNGSKEGDDMSSAINIKWMETGGDRTLLTR